MGKMKEQNIEQEEKEVTEENTVIEAPDNVTGDEPVSSEQVEQAEQEEVAESEVIDAPESITGDDVPEDKQEEKGVTKYKAKVCIYYNNTKYMPGDLLTGIETSTIQSLLKNGFIELV